MGTGQQDVGAVGYSEFRSGLAVPRIHLEGD